MAVEIACALLSPALTLAWSTVDAQTGSVEPVRDMALVCTVLSDGVEWRGVKDELMARGYRVSIVGTRMTSFTDDDAATRRVLASQDSPAILVGHCSGGPVITQTGAEEGRTGLVYIAASAPDVGVFRTMPRTVAGVIDRAAHGARA